MRLAWVPRLFAGIKPQISDSGDPTQHTRAWVLSALLFVFTIFSLLIIALQIILHRVFSWQDPDVQLTIVFLGGISLAFILNLRGHYGLAAALTLGEGIIMPFMMTLRYTPVDTDMLYYLIFSIICSTLFYDNAVRAVLVITTINLIGLLVLSSFIQTPFEELLIGPIRFVAVLCIILLTALIYLNYQHRERQKALALTKERFRIISELASDYAYSIRFEPNGRPVLEWVTEAFVRITGYHDADLSYDINTGAMGLIHPDDRDVIARRQRSLDRCMPFTAQFRIITKTGEVRWIRDTVSPIWDSMEGRVIRFYGTGRDITAQREAQDRLRASEARYRALVESQQDLILRYDTARHRFTFVNDAYCRKFGKSPTDFLIYRFLYLIHPADLRSTREALVALKYPPHRVQYEHRAETVEGWRWLAWETYAIVDDNGNRLELQAVGRDITDKKMAEAELNRRVEDLDFLRQIDHELGYTLDFQRVIALTMDIAIRRANAKACVVGWVEAGTHQIHRIAAVGESLLLETPLDMDNLPLFLQKVLQQTEEPLHVAYQIEGGGQSYLQTPFLIMPLAEEGQVHGLLALEGLQHAVEAPFLHHLVSRTTQALKNARAHQQIQQHARQINILYRLSQELAASLEIPPLQDAATRALLELFDASSACFLMYDKHTRVSTIESSHQLPSSTEHVEIGYAFSESRFPSRRPQDGLVTMRLSDEELKEYERQEMKILGLQSALFAPLIVENEFLGGLLIGESRTDRIFTAQEMTLLGNLQGQLSVGLQRVQLIHHLQTLERVKSEMIRMASHDLRNPLAQIGGYLELLGDELRSEQSETVQDYVGSIDRGVKKMSRLLEDILSLERAESQEPDTWHHVQVGMLLREVVEQMIEQAVLKKQTFTVDIPRDIPSVVGSDFQIGQAAVNLVGNAIKYTPTGGTIIIRAQTEHDRFMFTVEIFGYGIPEDRQSQLFKRFYRAHTPGTENIGGTGLGLSLVKTIIERHGGSVFFKSQYKQGSTFGFWLPLVIEEVAY